MRLLIIRPQPGADATARLARLAGVEPVIHPLFEIRPRTWNIDNPKAYDALIVTSANAIHYAGKSLDALSELPAYAVGEATANAARAAGLRVEWHGKADAAALIEQVKANGHVRLLWLAGEHRTNFQIPPDIELDSVLIYNSEALSATRQLLDLLTSPIVVALHSVRAAQHFRTICDAHDIDKSVISILTLSHAIAERANDGWARTLVADAPNDTALLSKMTSYFTSDRSDP